MSLLKYGNITLCDKYSSGPLKVEKLPDIVSPGKTRQQIKIPGRSGDLVIYDGSYENVIRRYEVFISQENTDSAATLLETIRGLLGEILKLKGYHELVDAYNFNEFSLGQNNGFYYAELLSGFEIINYFMRHGRCTLTFNCKPFVYATQIFAFRLTPDNWNSFSISNSGTAYCAPEIVFKNPSNHFSIGIKDSLAGTYSLTVNNLPQQVEAVLDCERMTFVGINSAGKQTNLFQYLEWEYLPAILNETDNGVVFEETEDYSVQLPLMYGDWTFSVIGSSGSLSEILITPRWRHIL